jgi:hypothetical protein
LIERRGEERREEAMATRNQTALFRKYREALRSVRPHVATSSGPHGGAIELVEAPLLNHRGPRGYNAIGGEDLDAGHQRLVDWTVVDLVVKL